MKRELTKAAKEIPPGLLLAKNVFKIRHPPQGVTRVIAGRNRPKQSFSVSRFASLALLLPLASGCFQGKSGWEETHKTTGVVTFKGKPIVDAELTFFPEDTSAPETVRPRAKTVEGGKFEAWTYQQGDGIPAGNYKVTVVHNEVAVSKGTIVAKPNSLPAKYSRLDSTDLVVAIAAGSNELKTIEIK